MVDAAAKRGWRGFLFVLALAPVLIACPATGDGDRAVRVRVEPVSAALTVGERLELVASVTGTSDQRIEWTASGGVVVGSDERATFTAPDATGTYEVTAVSGAFPNRSATALVHVLARGDGATLAIEPREATVAAGQTVDFTATLGGANDREGAWTWTATCGVIDALDDRATYTAAAELAPVCLVTVVHSAYPGESAVAVVTIQHGAGTLQLGVRDRSGHARPGASVDLTGPSGSMRAVADAAGVARFDGLVAGTYLAEVRIPPDAADAWRLVEYWGSVTVDVAPDGVTTGVFERAMPWFVGIPAWPEPAEVGMEVPLTALVSNPSGRPVRARARFGRSDCLPATCTTDGILGPETAGDHVGVSFTPTGTGRYRFALYLETRLDDGSWQITDQFQGADLVVAEARPKVMWTRRFGTPGSDDATALSVDDRANVFVAGSTKGALGEGAPVGTDDEDVFLRSYDRNGNERWTRQSGGPGRDEATGVAIDADGAIVVVGNTTGEYAGPRIGGDPRDAFVTKQDPAANFLWSHQFGTSQPDFAEAVAVDSAGIVYVVGSTAGSLGDLNDGWTDGYVRSFAPEGDVVRWTRQFGGSRSVYARSVATDTAGNVFVVGQAYGGLHGQEEPISSGFGDAFVISYDRLGEERWKDQFGTPGADRARGVAVDGAGNVFVVGGTTGDIVAGSGDSEGYRDAFVRKYAPDGAALWTRQFGAGNVYGTEALAVTVDHAGRVVVVGRTQGRLTVPGAETGAIWAFVRLYDAEGHEVWTHEFGPSEDERNPFLMPSAIARAVAVDVHGTIVIAGWTMGSWGGVVQGGSDAFVRALRP